MRPLKLTISGLNSFKDEQEIDFAKLSDLGIFGIFGPTGSGKSSILDAITLALYGIVDRAERGKQGIINHGEKKMNVSLSFALGVGEKRKIYRVDRAYKTKDHVSVQSIHSRLIDMTVGAEVIIAEKETEVNNYIEGLLGLKAEDFTRAVVLPQGSFADFLKMESGKRRVMLERLFTLEKYGRKLTDKLNTRLEAAKLKYNLLDGEHQGLGDASPDKLRAATDQKSLAAAAEQVAVNRLSEITIVCERSRKVYELQQEVVTKESALAHHQEKSHYMKQLNREVERAELAGQVKPLIDEGNHLGNKVAQAEEIYHATSGQLEQLQKQADVLSETLRCAKVNRKEHEPQFIVRKTQLDGALLVEKEVDDLRGKIEQVNSTIKSEEINLTTTNAHIAKVSTTIESLANSIVVLEEKIRDNHISIDDRQLVQKAGSMADGLEREIVVLTACESHYAERKNNVTKTKTTLATTEKKVTELTTEITTLSCAENEVKAMCPGDEEVLGQQEIRVAELKVKLRQLTVEDQKLKAEGKSAKMLMSQLATARTEYQNIKIKYETSQADMEVITTQLNELLISDWQAMAANLAKNLESGQPCPVCGSDHHPTLAMMSSTTIEKGSKEELEANMIVARGKVADVEVLLRKAEGQIIGIQTKLDTVQDNVQILSSQLEKEIISIGGLWETPIDQFAVASIAKLAECEELKLVGAKEKLKVWRNERQLVEKRIRELEQEVGSTQNDVAAYRAAHHAATAEMERVGIELREMTQKVEERSKELVGILLEIDPTPDLQSAGAILLVARLRDELANRDRQMDALQKEIGQKRSKQQEEQSQREVLLKAQKQREESIAVLKVQENGWLKSAKEQQDHLNQVGKGVPITILLTQLAEELDELRDTESNAEEGYKTNQESLLHMKQKLTVEQTKLSSFSTQLSEIMIRLAEKRLEFSFPSNQEVESAYLDVTVLGEKRKEIRAYDDEERKLMAQRNELVGKLNGQSISHVAWEELQQQLRDAMNNKEQAMEERINGDRILTDISSRHERWLILENELLLLKDQLRHLNTLKTLIRGNMLVEFMAQEQMEIVLSQASERLKQLTNNRYALEMASDGSFLIRDDDNGGVRRPVNMLSGGETFQTSLALALALSTHIQLRGQHPLEFFFLDEGFGSLDQKSLEVVMSSLERLPLERMVIGLISHVDTLQQRLLRRLIVEPAEPNGRGSQVKIEIA